MSVENFHIYLQDATTSLTAIERELCHPTTSKNEVHLKAIVSALITTLGRITAGFSLLEAEMNYQKLKFLISHLSALTHHKKLITGSSVFDDEEKSGLNDLIKRGGDLLAQQQHTVQTSTPKDPILSDNASITRKEDNNERERECFDEQQKYEQDANFYKLLHELWRYAITEGYRSKRVFISYAWPNGDEKQELWTKLFVTTLAKHLINAGIQVFLDQKHSGAGYPLSKFMQKINKVDHVLIISTRTMKDKLERPESGVSYEHNEIRKCLDRDGQLLKKRFVIPVLLNFSKYCHNDFSTLAEVSLCQQGYLSALYNILKHLYDAGDLTFEKWWKQRLLMHQLKGNLWGVSLHKNNHFTGRTAVLRDIENTFDTSDNQLVIVTTHGLGGVGKTQLALKYVLDHHYNFDSVYWFSVNSSECLSSREQLIQQYLRLGREKKLWTDNGTPSPNANEERAQLVKEWLQHQAPKPWLLVYDSADNYEEIKSLLPIIGDGRILITTRYTNSMNVKTIKLNVFTLEETREFVRRITMIENEEEPLQLLYQTLGGLPLALSIACTFIKKTGKTIAAYLVLYKYEQNELFHLKGNEQESLDIVWNITLKSIQEKSSTALKLLQCCAYLDSENIPTHFLHDILRAMGVNSEVKRENDLILLKDYSMIAGGQQSISIHCLIQAVIRNQLTAQPEYECTLLGYTMNALCSTFFAGRFAEETQKKYLLLSQAESFIQYTKNIPSFIRQENYYYLRKKIGEFIWEHYGNANKVKDYNLLGLQIIEHIDLPDKTYQIAETWTGLGYLYTTIGNKEEAFKAFEKSKEYTYQLPDSETKQYHVANTLKDQAVAYSRFDDPPQALICLASAKSIYEQYNLDPQKLKLNNHQALLLGDIYLNMGNALFKLKQYSEALTSYDQAIVCYKRLQIDDHLKTSSIANVFTQMADLYLEQQDWDKAETAALQAIALHAQELYGQHHIMIADANKNLGRAYLEQGNIEKALHYLEIAYQIYLKNYGSQHATTTFISRLIDSLKLQEPEPFFASSQVMFEQKKLSNVLPQNNKVDLSTSLSR